MGNVLDRCSCLSDESEQDFQANLVETLETEDISRFYSEVRTLGEGITGSVKEVIDRNGHRFAMKSINLARFNKAQLKELENEIDLLRNLDHPNIIKIYRVFKSRKDIYIVMELLTGGELAKRILKKEHEIIKVATELLSACKYWHSRNIVHRDLKLENILFADKEPNSPIKVIDFGLGTWFETRVNLACQLPAYVMAKHKKVDTPETSKDSFFSFNSDSKPIADDANTSTDANANANNRLSGNEVDTLFSNLVEAKANKQQSFGINSTSLQKKKSKLETFGLRKTLQKLKSSSLSKTKSERRGSRSKQNYKLNSVEENKRLRRIMLSQVGTAYYMAPEITQDIGYDHKADVWAIGVIIFMLIAHKAPFAGQSESEIFHQISLSKPSFDSPNWLKISPHARTLVTGLLEPDVNKRLTAEQALNSPWISLYKSLKNKANGNSSGDNNNSVLTQIINKEPEIDVDKNIIDSFKRFVKYTQVKKAALMVIAHKADSSTIAKLRDIFSEMDIYRTGTITLEELRIALKKHNIVGADVDALFEKLDQDRSGHIRYMEFLAATIETQKIISANELAEAFDHLDTDKSGYITKRNLKKLLGKDFSDSEVERMIKESDITGDNKISREEFMQMMTTVKDQENGDIIKEAVQLDVKPFSIEQQVTKEMVNMKSSEIKSTNQTLKDQGKKCSKNDFELEDSTKTKVKC